MRALAAEINPSFSLKVNLLTLFARHLINQLIEASPARYFSGDWNFWGQGGHATGSLNKPPNPAVKMENLCW